MSRHEWESAATAGTVDPLSPERLDEMWAWTQRNGPTNSWTGTTGTPAAMIRELLQERAAMLKQQDRRAVAMLDCLEGME